MTSAKPAVIAALLVPLAFGACAGRTSTTAAKASSSPPAVSASVANAGITTRGTGRVPGSPDVVTVSIGVEITAAKAVDALAQNSAKARAVISALTGGGVEGKDVQTAQLSLWPEYAPNRPVVTGYHVTDTVTAKLRDIAKAGAVIDSAVTAAGDAGRLQGVSFSIDDAGPLKEQARKDAVTQARRQAEQVAAAAGVRLGALRSVREVNQDTPVYGLSPTAALGGAAQSAPAPTPVQPGTEELTVVIEATWDVG